MAASAPGAALGGSGGGRGRARVAGVKHTLSASAIMRRTSSRLGSKPIARIATLSSSESIFPESSVSKSLNASRISSSWSAVRFESLLILVARGGSRLAREARAAPAERVEAGFSDTFLLRGQKLNLILESVCMH